MKKVFAAFIAALLLAGCGITIGGGNSTPVSGSDQRGWFGFGGPKQGIGTVGGAALGAWGASAIGGGKGKLVAVAAGTLIGAFLGGEVGSSLDRADRAAMAAATERAFAAPVGSPIAWSNTETGSRGAAQAVQAGVSSDGRACKRVHSKGFFVGRTGATSSERVTIEAMACQAPDGSWQVADTAAN